MTLAQILQQVHDLQLTPEEAEPLVQEIIDAAADRDAMAMSVMQGMLAARMDTNMENLVDTAYVTADKMIARRARP